MKREKIIYVAGKYSAKTSREIDKNVAFAKRAAIKIWMAGGTAICPHLNTYKFEDFFAWKEILRGDFEIIKRCDAVYFLPNWTASKGAKMERRFAQKHKIPIYDSLDYLMEDL